MKRLNVMQIIGNLDIGGAQEVVRTLSQGLSEQGCQVVVCSFQDGPFRGEIERLGIPVEILPKRRYSILALPWFIREMFTIRRTLLKLVEKYQVDVIQTHLLRSLDFLVGTLRFGSSHPLVFWTVHNVNFALRPDQLSHFRWLAGAKQAAHNWLYRRMAGLINGFIAVSNDVSASIIKTIAPRTGQVTTISNGVDVRRYHLDCDRLELRRSLGLDEHDLLFVVVGTLKEQKGHCYLFEAVAPLVNRFPQLKILVAGDGGLRARLEAQVRDLGLERHIIFLGNRGDVPALLSASDAFVLPSLWEGLPMALIEAMASGLPVIATRVSGSLDVVVDGESGLLVPPGSAADLCSAISAVITDPDRAQQMGKAAEERIEALFGARKQVAEHLALYQREWSKVLER